MVAEELHLWLRQKIGQELSQDPSAVDLNSDFDELNLDSLSVVTLAYDLETYTDLSIDPTVFSEFKTPNDLAQWILSQKS